MYDEAGSPAKIAFNREFFQKAQGGYAMGSQCANAMPLVFGLVPSDQRERVLASLVNDVQTHGLTTGDVGYRYLLRALADAGRSDIIFTLNNQSEKPGYGYQLAHGATSLTEAWDAGYRSSQDHFMLGQIMEWFYHDLAGIGLDPAAPGFKHIIIRPQLAGDITWARADYESLRGRIHSAWNLEAGQLVLEVEIPVGATATVFVPAVDPVEVKAPAGAMPLPAEPGYAVFAVGSGFYQFTRVE